MGLLRMGIFIFVICQVLGDIVRGLSEMEERVLWVLGFFF